MRETEAVLEHVCVMGNGMELMHMCSCLLSNGSTFLPLLLVGLNSFGLLNRTGALFVYELARSAWRFEDQTVQRMLEAVQKIQKEFDVSIATMQDLSEKVPVAHAGRVGGTTHCHAR